MKTLFRLNVQTAVKTALAAFAGVFLLVQGVAAQSLDAAEAGAMHIRAISVDVSGLRARGEGAFADAVKATVQAQAERIFASRMVRDAKGANVVIKVDSVEMTSFSHHLSRSRLSSNDTTKDYMEGAIVVSRAGRVLVNHPMLAAFGSNSSPGTADERLNVLSNYYVSWLKREVGL